MHRREFLIGAAAGLAAVPAWAGRASLPLRSLAAARQQGRVRRLGQANRGEEVKYLERRFDRYREVLAFNDLWTPAEKRAFLMTPREEFVLPEDKEQAYVGHYLDIGFGVTITPPGTMGRMTSALQLREGEKALEIGTGSGYQSALPDLPDPESLFDRDHPGARGAHPRRLRPADRQGLSRIFKHRDPQRRRLLRLGGGGAVRQDHRHLRHRPHPPAAPPAIEAGRDHGDPGRPAGGAAYFEGGQEDRGGRGLQRVEVGYFWRQGDPVRAAERRPSGELTRRRHLVHTLWLCIALTGPLPARAADQEFARRR